MQERKAVLNPTIYMNGDTYGYQVEIITHDFDMNFIEDKWISFLNGFKKNSTEYLKAISGALQYWYGGWVRNFNYFKVNNADSAIIGMSDLDYFYLNKGNYTYTGEKEILPWILKPKDFIVVNNPNMFPNDGVKGSYYFNLIGQIDSVNIYSLADDVSNDVKNLSVDEIRKEVLR